jgi:hypothetical protein
MKAKIIIQIEDHANPIRFEKGDKGYVDGYVTKGGIIKAIVVVNECFIQFSLHEIKAIKWKKK